MGQIVLVKPVAWPDLELSKRGKYSKIDLCVNFHKEASGRLQGGRRHLETWALQQAEAEA